MKIGRIPYINCYPVYGAIDRGVVQLDAELVDGVPTDLNRRMASNELDISVVSAVEYARDSERYLLLPDLAISCDGPVRSVMLFSKRPASELTSRNVIVSRSSMTSVALLELLFENVWHSSPRFVPGDAEVRDVIVDSSPDPEARLVIGDAVVNRAVQSEVISICKVPPRSLLHDHQPPLRSGFHRDPIIRAVFLHCVYEYSRPVLHF